MRIHMCVQSDASTEALIPLSCEARILMGSLKAASCSLENFSPTTPRALPPSQPVDYSSDEMVLGIHLHGSRRAPVAANSSVGARVPICPRPSPSSRSACNACLRFLRSPLAAVCPRSDTRHQGCVGTADMDWAQHGAAHPCAVQYSRCSPCERRVLTVRQRNAAKRRH